MTARVREFNAFLRDHVNLNQTRVDTLQSRVTALADFLVEDSDIAAIVTEELKPQGSFAHKTIIRPLQGNDFDADVLLPMEEQSDWKAKKYTVELQKALEASARYAGKTTLKRRCVTITFANDFHIDVVPFITRSDGQTYITHRLDDQFLRCDPTAFTSWVAEKARSTNGHLTRAVRLIKYLRDRSSIHIPSVVLTALLAERVRSFGGSSEYRTVASTLVELTEALNDYIGPMTSRPWVDDRTGQNLADRLTESGFANLQSQVKTWARKMRSALDSEPEDSVAAWQAIFGEGFGATQAEKAVVGSTTRATFEKQPAPGEQFLDRDFGIPVNLDPHYSVRVVGRAAARAAGTGRMRPIGANGNHVRIGRRLSFTVENCTVPEPYEIYWKVRNAGPDAAERNMFRGQIISGGSRITETSDFAGNHWVEAWIVKDGVAVAWDTQDVTILRSS